MSYSINNQKFEEIISGISVLFSEVLERDDLEKIFSIHKENLSTEIDKVKSNTKVVQDIIEKDITTYISSYFHDDDLYNTIEPCLSFEQGNKVFFNYLINKFPELELEQYLNHEAVKNFISLNGKICPKNYYKNIDKITLKMDDNKDVFFVNINDTEINIIITFSDNSIAFHKFLADISPIFKDLNNNDNEIIKEFKKWFNENENFLDNDFIESEKNEIEKLSLELKELSESLTKLITDFNTKETNNKSLIERIFQSVFH